MATKTANPTTAENVNQAEDYSVPSLEDGQEIPSDETEVQGKESDVGKAAKDLWNATSDWLSKKKDQAAETIEEAKDKAEDMAKDMQTRRAGGVHHDVSERVQESVGTKLGTAVGLAKNLGAYASGAALGTLQAAATAGSPEKLIAAQANENLSKPVGSCSPEVGRTEDGEQMLHYHIDADVAKALGVPPKSTGHPVRFNKDGIFTAEIRPAPGAKKRTYNCMPLRDGSQPTKNWDNVVGLLCFAAEKGREDVRFFIRE